MIGDLFMGLGIVVLGTASGALTVSFAMIDVRRAPAANQERGALGAYVGAVVGFGVGCMVAGWVLT